MKKITRPEVVGLVGLGLVGTAIFEHLLAFGIRVIGYDIDPDQCEFFEGRGGILADSPAGVSCQADHVVLSLMTTEIVCSVIEGKEGLLEASNHLRFIIDTTTGDPDQTIALAGRLQQLGIQYLDAPISGSSQQISDRKALFMVGGSATAYQSCEAIFSAITDKSMYVGPSGSGSKAKLASNLILGLNRLVLAEGLVFAEKLGLDLRPFLSLLKQSPAYSMAMDAKGEKMISNDFSTQAKVSQHFKDLELILGYANSLGQPLLLGQLHKQVLSELIADGDGDLDNSVVIKAIRNNSS